MNLGKKKLLEEVLPLHIIREVEKWPVLYARDCPERNNARFRLKVWSEVAKAVFPDWETYSKDEQEDKIKDLSKKWRNLRDTFKRHLEISKKISEGQNIKKKEYVYFKYMSFLLPHVLETDETVAMVPKNQPSHRKREFPIPRINVKEIVKRKKIVSNATTSDSPEEAIDEDKHFLMSLIPSFKRMTDDEKLTAKVEILKVIKEVRSNSHNLDSYNYPAEVDSLAYNVDHLDAPVKTELFSNEQEFTLSAREMSSDSDTVD